MRDVIRIDPLARQRSRAPWDRSGLLNLLLFNQSSSSVLKEISDWTFASQRKEFKSLERARLNPSQRKAAQTILSPDSGRLCLIQAGAAR